MRRFAHGTLGAAALLLSGLTGCVGSQSALDPAGPQAGREARLFWAMLVVATAVCVMVYVALFWASARAKRRQTVLEGPEVDRRMTRAVSIAAAATVVILLGFLVASFATGRQLTASPGPDALVIRLIGRQWWWEARYLDPVPSNQLTTANEIHIPVGRPVRFVMTARDVIHSLWIPNLAGKRDLIPGKESSLWIRADRPGVYRAQCAEFCGHQHAKMALLVIAEPADQYASWYAQSLRPNVQPTDSVRQRGLAVFQENACALCHTISGTLGGGKAGPDLSHLASRRTLAAGSIPNTPGHLGGWIVDPQGIKPGAKMPTNQLAPADLQALLAYLEGLK